MAERAACGLLRCHRTLECVSSSIVSSTETILARTIPCDSQEAKNPIDFQEAVFARPRGRNSRYLRICRLASQPLHDERGRSSRTCDLQEWPFSSSAEWHPRRLQSRHAEQNPRGHRVLILRTVPRAPEYTRVVAAPSSHPCVMAAAGGCCHTYPCVTVHPRRWGAMSSIGSSSSSSTPVCSSLLGTMMRVTRHARAI